MVLVHLKNESGDAHEKGNVKRNIRLRPHFFPVIVLDKTPNTSLQYRDALRDLKYREAIYEILAKQCEMAKLDEAKDSPLIQVLDKATVPEKKSKLKRSMMVLSATLAALFLTMLWAFVRESMSRAKQQPEQAKRMQALHNAFKWRARRL